MIYQSNKAGFWLGFTIAIPLAIFSAWRNWDLFASVLPASQVLAAFFGLAALDGGFVGWAFGYIKGKGDQRGIAGTLSVICFLGSMLGMFLDLYISLVDKGFLDSQKGNIYVGAIVLISLAIAINTGGGVLYALNDPKTKQEIRDQKAHDKINSLADAQIEQHAAMYAPEFARAKVDLWLAQARMIHGLMPINQASMLPPSASVPALPPAQVAKPPQPQSEQSALARLNPANWFADKQPAQQAPQTVEAPVQPAQPKAPSIDQALLAAMQQIADQAAANAAKQTIERLTIPATPAKGPTTDELNPLALAPTENNGNGANPSK